MLIPINGYTRNAHDCHPTTHLWKQELLISIVIKPFLCSIIVSCITLLIINIAKTLCAMILMLTYFLLVYNYCSSQHRFCVVRVRKS